MVIVTTPTNTTSPGDVELGTPCGAPRQALPPSPPCAGEETEAQGHTATEGCILNAKPGQCLRRAHSLPCGTQLSPTSTKPWASAPVRKPSALNHIAPGLAKFCIPSQPAVGAHLASNRWCVPGPCLALPCLPVSQVKTHAKQGLHPVCPDLR